MSCGSKKVVGHYTNSILATTDAKNNGYDEALLCDAKGYIAEGPGQISLLKKMKFYTLQEEIFYQDH